MQNFYGVNTAKVIADNEFQDLNNVVSTDYPVIRTREKRKKLDKQFAALNAIMYKDGLFYIEQGKMYYKEQFIADMTEVAPNMKRELLSFGAYILIFPDKKIFNTQSGTVESLDANHSYSGQVRYEPVIHDSAFTKIHIPGVHEKFKRYDSIKIKCTLFDKVTVINEIGTNYIVISGKINESATHNETITITRSFPEFDFMCECQNRVWLCNTKKHEIYASKLGDPFNFNNFEGLDGDSYAVTVASDGDFTGCIGHNGYVLFFKERQILKMFGDKPSNFQLKTYDYIGVKKGCHKTLLIANESLYYVGSDGAVYLYDGAIPMRISDKISKINVNGYRSVYHDDTIYICNNKPRENGLLAYNTLHRIWTMEDNADMQHTYMMDAEVYYIDRNGISWKLIDKENTSEEVISWFLESGKTDEGTIYNKFISKLIFHIHLARNAKVEIWIRHDDEPMYTHIATVKSDRDKTISIPIIPKRCQSFQYRLDGKGAFCLLGIARNINEGSEI